VKANTEKIDTASLRAAKAFIRAATAAKRYAAGPGDFPACGEKTCKICPARKKLFHAVVSVEHHAEVPDPPASRTKNPQHNPWDEVRAAEGLPARGKAVKAPEDLTPGEFRALRRALDRFGAAAKDYAAKEMGECADPSCLVCRSMRPLLRALLAAERLRPIRNTPYTAAHKPTWARIRKILS